MSTQDYNVNVRAARLQGELARLLRWALDAGLVRAEVRCDVEQLREQLLEQLRRRKRPRGEDAA